MAAYYNRTGYLKVIQGVADLALPCDDSFSTSLFGYRNLNIAGSSTNHEGVDMRASSGSNIYAAASGTITAEYYNQYRGYVLEITHGNGYMTRYQHLSKYVKLKGTAVTAGTIIAKSGSSGIGSGAHLHFEIRKNGTAVNPEKYTYTRSRRDARGFGGASATGSAATSTTVEKKSKANAGVSTGTTSTAGNTKSIKLSTQDGTTASVEIVKKDISRVVIQSTDGKTATQARTLASTKDLNTGLELFIQNQKIYKPRLEGEVTLEQPRAGGPATLKFTCCKDGVLDFHEGNPVALRYNGVGIFFGFVFTKKRQDSFLIDVTAYDQLRYLKNEDTISYQNKTYAQLVKLLADSCGLTCGTLEDTGYTMTRIEEGTMLDMLGNAADETLLHTKKQYVLYDEYGSLTLKNISSMRVPILVDAQTAQSYDYKTSIDSKVYSRVKMALDDDTTGQRNVYVYNNTELQRDYGVLQYYEKVQEGTTTANMQEKAKSILSYYGQKRRNLRVSGVFGDIRVRGGCSLAVDLNLGDLIVKNYMVAETVTHRWEDGSYFMDLVLTGIKGEFVA